MKKITKFLFFITVIFGFEVIKTEEHFNHSIIDYRFFDGEDNGLISSLAGILKQQKVDKTANNVKQKKTQVTQLDRFLRLGKFAFGCVSVGTAIGILYYGYKKYFSLQKIYKKVESIILNNDQITAILKDKGFLFQLKQYKVNVLLQNKWLIIPDSQTFTLEENSLVDELKKDSIQIIQSIFVALKNDANFGELIALMKQEGVHTKYLYTFIEKVLIEDYDFIA